ncbi:MAG TPA: FAD-dependent oxidoreductase [Candidatus Babeliales bacterium]|nr:FAD-dependent oxidoreductase [Candidatus Babeliales bacterium]
MMFKQKNWYKALALPALMLFLGLAVVIQRVSASKKEFDINAIFTKDNVKPLVVIGSGPAGLAAAHYALLDNVPTIIFAGSTPGGLLMTTDEVINWPGDLSVKGMEIIEKLNKQVEVAGGVFEYDSIESIDISDWPYALRTQGGTTIHAMAVVIATGARPLKLGIPGEQLSGVTTCAICDAPLPGNKDKEAIVVGGGDSAIEEAIQSSAHQKKVTIIVRKDHMRASAHMQGRLKDYPKISIIYTSQVKEVLGEKGRMTGVTIVNSQTGEESYLPAHIMFLAIGHIPNSDFVASIVSRDTSGYILTQGGTKQTSVPGIFAAGEVEDHRYRQAGTSYGDGIKAGLDVRSFLQDIGFSPAIAQRLAQQELAQKNIKK